jgi:hypothetical protein
MNIIQVVSRSDISTFNTGSCRVVKLALDPSEKVLYCGTNTGSIRVYKWPLATPAAASPHAAAGDKHGDGDGASSLSFALPEPEYVEFPLHSSSVTGMVVSADGRCLFSSADDGTVFAMGIPYPLPSRASKALASLSSTLPSAAGGAGAYAARLCGARMWCNPMLRVVSAPLSVGVGGSLMLMLMLISLAFLVFLLHPAIHGSGHACV